MRTVIVIVEYRESDWGTDLVAFSLSDGVSDSLLMETLEEKSSQLLEEEDYTSSQDRIQDAIMYTSQTLDAPWKYVHQAGVLRVVS